MLSQNVDEDYCNLNDQINWAYIARTFQIYVLEVFALQKLKLEKKTLVEKTGQENDTREV